LPELFKKNLYEIFLKEIKVQGSTLKVHSSSLPI